MLAALECFGGPVEKTSYDDFYVEATELVAVAAALDSRPMSSSASLRRARKWTRDGPAAALDDADALPADVLRGCVLAERMRAAVLASVGLTVSVGVGRSKVVARMLSPDAKPDGVLGNAARRANHCAHPRRPPFPAALPLNER